MRKIEKQMLAAINARKCWTGGNTTVIAGEVSSLVALHGNHIATVYYSPSTSVEVNMKTLAKWPTRTTLARLRAFGVNVRVKGGIVEVKQ